VDGRGQPRVPRVCCGGGLGMAARRTASGGRREPVGVDRLGLPVGMVLGMVVVVPAGEAMARLLDWQGRERGLLDEWWAARRDHDDALAMRDRLVIGRDRA